jgi:hypothetical protein
VFVILNDLLPVLPPSIGIIEEVDFARCSESDSLGHSRPAAGH